MPRTERETARASKQMGAVGFALPTPRNDSGRIKARDGLAGLAYHLHSLIYFDSTDRIEETRTAFQRVKRWLAHRNEVFRVFGEQAIVTLVAGGVIFVDRRFENGRSAPIRCAISLRESEIFIRPASAFDTSSS